MNIRDFYNIHDGNLLEPFEDSEYVNGVDKYVGDVVKTFIIAYTSDETDVNSPDIPKQLATGGVAKRSAKATTTDKEQKWSFCSEIQSMSMSLVGLIGFDMSKQLFVLIGIKQIMQNIVNDMLIVENWNSLLKTVSMIKNIYFLDDGTEHTEDCIHIAETFDLFKYLENPNKVCDDGSPICTYYLADRSSRSIKEVLFTYIESYLKDRCTHKSESFKQVKNYIKEIFDDLLLHTVLTNYCINDVNALCLNLDSYDVCYTPSILKCFETFYQESYGDVPDECRHDEKLYLAIVDNMINPVISTLNAPSSSSQNVNKNLKRVDVSKLQEKLLIYYKQIFHSVGSTSMETLNKNILNVICTDAFYEQVIDITIYTLIQVARNIASQLITAKYFGESTRIQFIHFYNGVLGCCPHCELFNIYQRNVIYWALCPKKAIEKSLKTLQEENKVVASKEK